MRLLQIQVGPHSALDLHPRLSVVRGLTRTQTEVLIDSVTALAEGRRGPVPGLLEAHGVLFPLDSAVMESLPHPGPGPSRIVASEPVPTPVPSGRAGPGRGEATDRLKRARSALDEAEEQAHHGQPDRDAVHQLEVIHGRLLAARSRSSARVGRAKARQRAAQLESMEAAQLEALGFSTYAEYLRGTELPAGGSEAEGRVDAARLELLAAEAALRQASSPAERPSGRPIRRSRVGDVLHRARAAATAPTATGALPVVLVDVLRGLSSAEVHRLLDELDDITAHAQVLVLADEPRAEAWATSAGVRRAAVVHPAEL